MICCNREKGIDSVKLSPSESKVYELMCKGFTNKQMAKHLGVKEKTVKFHATNVFAKKGVRSKSELIAKHYLKNTPTIKERIEFLKLILGQNE